MLVGEAPGADEERLGKPFVGQAGQILDDCLDKAGLSRAEVYVSNAVKCRPPGNRDPTKEEVGACIRYLLEEIQLIQPKVIVCVGRWALKTLTGEDTISRARGRLLSPLPKLHLGNVKLIATTHPAAYLHQRRNQAVLDGIVEDLRYTKNLIAPKHIESKRHLLFPGFHQPSAHQFYAALHELTDAKVLACDLEWSAPKPDIGWPWSRGVEQLSMSLTGRVDGQLRTAAFPWPLPSGVSLIKLNKFLDRHKLIFHNAMADAIWLLHQGIRFTVGGDSMLLSYLLDEQRRAGLKGLSPLVSGTEAGWEQKPWHTRPTSRKGWQELLTYNAQDTENTLILHEDLIKQVQVLDPERRDNLLRVYRTLLLPAVVPFARIALNGTPINEKALAREIRKHRALRDAAVQELAGITGLRADVAERLAGSAQQVTRYAREAYGLEIETSRADDLSDYVMGYPALQAIQNFKHERKMLSTYLEPWQRLLQNQGDGRLHSIYLLGATRTGRLSADLEEGGSLLLTPRDDWMRDLIATPDDDWEIHAADYSQIELRMIAWLAPERTMRRLYREGADLHATTAAYAKARLPIREFWSKRKELVAQVTKDERQIGKSHGFGLVFGLQAAGYVVYAKNKYGIVLTEQEAEDSRKGFFALYSDLQTWHDRVTAVDYERGFTVTPFGRYRFNLADPTKAINTPIQATATDLTLLALTVIDERLQAEVPEAQIIGFVHDAILVLAPKSFRREVQTIIRQSMEQPPLERVGIDEIPVPLVADVHSGSTWAKAH